MALALFDVTPSRVQIGELFDTNRKYVYKDTNNGQLTTTIRDPVGSGDYYDYRYLKYSEQTDKTTWYWGDIIAITTGFPSSVNVGAYTYYNNSYETSTSAPGPFGEIYYTYYYRIYRTTNRNLNIIRLPQNVTIDNNNNNLTYSFDGETSFINSQVYINTANNILYIGVM